MTRIPAASTLLLTLALLTGMPGVGSADEPVPVTVDNFIRAETDNYLKSFVGQGAFGKFVHNRRPTPIDKQNIIRMNRDTLYSMAVFDLDAGPVTIHKPDTGGRYQSIEIINEDHYTPMVVYKPGKFKLTRDNVGTRYVVVSVRTFVDANNPADVKKANALQDKITAEQASKGKFEIPDWDKKSLDKLRNAINVVAKTTTTPENGFGKKGEVNPLWHLFYTAYGWGGLPLEDATYVNVVPAKNDGKTPYTLTVKDVPVGGFWSVTVYNKDGFLEKNAQNAYSFNNKTAKKNKDGSVTINFGRGADAVNNIPITPGWNYIVRLYRPHKDILDGKWTFPEAKPVKE